MLEEDVGALKNGVFGENETNMENAVGAKGETASFSILDDQRQELERIIKKKKRKLGYKWAQQIVSETLVDSGANCKTTLKGKSVWAMV